MQKNLKGRCISEVLPNIPAGNRLVWVPMIFFGDNFNVFGRRQVLEIVKLSD